MFPQSFPSSAFCSKFKSPLPLGRKEEKKEGRKKERRGGKRLRPKRRKMREGEEVTDARQRKRRTRTDTRER